MDALTSATTMLDRGHESLVPMVRFLTEATRRLSSVARVLACEGSAVRCHQRINALRGPFKH